ncbi:MAG: prolyl oligopeptidase family serine peptidase [Planctomycetaceae bacterium]
MRSLILLLIVCLFGCEGNTSYSVPSHTATAPARSQPAQRTPEKESPANEKCLVEAKAGFVTRIVRSDDPFGPPDVPTGPEFSLIQYKSPVGDLPAYVMPDPGDTQKHPAIVWIHGGDCNSIGDVWTARDRDDDQSASAFRKAGIIMMFPSLRGGNENPGKREGFFGEVDDVLAATDYLAGLPYVDPQQIYLGGHSTGGTLVMLVAASSDRYRAVFSLGPVATAQQYGGRFIYCDFNDAREIELRSPVAWLHCVKSPMYVMEGAESENWRGASLIMSQHNKNPQIRFIPVPGYDHFNVIAPLTELIASQIIHGEVNITPQLVQNLR